MYENYLRKIAGVRALMAIINERNGEMRKKHARNNYHDYDQIRDLL